MPRKSDKLTISNKKLDRRVKLTEEQKEEILDLKDSGISQRKVASMYNISRRMVQFIWFPEKLEQNRARRKERGGSKQYYDKEKNNAAMRKHREYKKELFKEGLIK